MSRTHLACWALIMTSVACAAYYGYGIAANANTLLDEAETNLEQTLSVAKDTGEKLEEEFAQPTVQRGEIVSPLPDFFRPVSPQELSNAAETAARDNAAVADLLQRYEAVVAGRNAELDRYSSLWLERCRLLFIEKDLLVKLDAASGSMLATDNLRREDITACIKGAPDEQSTASNVETALPSAASDNAHELTTLMQSYEENHQLLVKKSAEFVAARDQLAELQLRVDDMNALLEAQLIHQRRSEVRVQALRKMQLLFTGEEPTFVAAPHANDQTADETYSTAVRKQLSQLRTTALKQTLEQMNLLLPREERGTGEEAEVDQAPQDEKVPAGKS